MYTPTPPSSGAIVGGTLQILDHFKPNLDEEPMAIYRYIEATKFAFAQRSKFGDWQDPDINQSVNETVGLDLATAAVLDIGVVFLMHLQG